MSPVACLLRTHPEGADTARYLAWAAEVAAVDPTVALLDGVRVAGTHRPWLAAADGRWAVNGLFAVADGEGALAEVRDLVAAAPGAPAAPAVVLATVDRPREEALAALALRTSAELALDVLRDLVCDRPRATEEEIRACERWLRHRLGQYLTGRGALQAAVTPWERFLARYEHAVRTIDRAWRETVLPALAARGAGDPLAGLVAPLGLVRCDRDLDSITPEYRARLQSLTHDCMRVAGEIGVVGTLGSLALVPVTDTLGPLFLVPVALAAAAYYGGYPLARRLDRRRHSRPPVVPASTRSTPPSAPPLCAGLARLRTEPVHVLAGPGLSSVDAACALRLQLDLLEQGGALGLDRVRVTATDPGRGVRLVVGGPLVRSEVVGRRPVCDLSDAHGDGWEVRAEGRRIAAAASDESLGCISLAAGHDDVVFVFGTRDTGTVRAARWLGRALASDDEPAAMAAPGPRGWAVLRGGRVSCAVE